MYKFIISVALALAVGGVAAKGGGHSGGHSGGRSGGGHASGNAHGVKGYTKKNGKYVAPHRATNPDKSKANNWSSKPNVNPDTGKSGTVDPNKP